MLQFPSPQSPINSPESSMDRPYRPASVVTEPGSFHSSQFGRIALCIPTCQRPGDLTELLNTVRDMDRTGLDLHLIVVDNDADQSAREVVAKAMEGCTIPVHYDYVGERNLPIVRNRLIELAQGIHADWIWFVDDDSLVEPDALKIMLLTAETYDADCVAPHVPHLFEDSERPWAQWSGLFQDRQRPTGQPTSGFGTNGKLLRVKAVTQIEEPFDKRLAITGGSDGLFFARFHAHGFKTVGCNEATIYDRVHPGRNNTRWLTRRALRIGLVKGFIVREVQPSKMRTAKWVLIGTGYAAVNLLAAAVLFPLGPSRYFRYWIRATRGYGIASGTLFPMRLLRSQEYAQVHGS